MRDSKTIEVLELRVGYVTFIATVKLNDIDPQARLADVLARLRIIPPSAFMNSCLGGGDLRASLTLLEPWTA